MLLTQAVTILGVNRSVWAQVTSVHLCPVVRGQGHCGLVLRSPVQSCRHIGPCHWPPAPCSPLCSLLGCHHLGSKMQLFYYTNYEQVLQLSWTILNMLKAQGSIDKDFRHLLPDNSSQQGNLPRFREHPHSTVNKGSSAVDPCLLLSFSLPSHPTIGRQDSSSFSFHSSFNFLFKFPFLLILNPTCSFNSANRSSLWSCACL